MFDFYGKMTWKHLARKFSGLNMFFPLERFALPITDIEMLSTIYGHIYRNNPPPTSREKAATETDQQCLNLPPSSLFAGQVVS